MYLNKPSGENAQNSSIFLCKKLQKYPPIILEGEDILKKFLSISVFQNIQINSLIFTICSFHTRNDCQRREHFIPE